MLRTLPFFALHFGVLLIMLFATGMMETPWIPVAGQAMRLGVGLYLVPLAFIANPALVYPDETPWLAGWEFIKVAADLWLISRGLIGAGAISWRTPAFLMLGFLAISVVPSA